MTVKKLYRSKKDKVVAGVCGGLAEYLDIDAIWIRIVTIVLLVNGIGFLIYLLAWILVPVDPHLHNVKDTKAEELVSNFKKKYDDKKKAKDKTASKVVDVKPENLKKEKKHSGHGSFMLGIVLVLFGTFMVLNKVFPLFDTGFIWASVVFLMGIHFLWKGANYGK